MSFLVAIKKIIILSIEKKVLLPNWFSVMPIDL